MGHKGYVNTIIELKDGKLASCSSDSTIKLWGWWILFKFKIYYHIFDLFSINQLSKLIKIINQLNFIIYLWLGLFKKFS